MSASNARLSKVALVLVTLFGLLVACQVRADHYRSGNLEQLMATPNWELVRQDMDARTGEDIGRPMLVSRYDTLAECDRNQQGRVSRAHRGRVSRFWCRHKGDDVV